MEQPFAGDLMASAGVDGIAECCWNEKWALVVVVVAVVVVAAAKVKVGRFEFY